MSDKTQCYTVIEETHVGEISNTAAHMIFKQRTTLARDAQWAGELEFPGAKMKPAEIVSRTEQQAAVLFKCRKERRKEVIHDLRPSVHQQMDMSALRNALAHL